MDEAVNNNPTAAYQYAGFWSRLGASIIDSILIILVILPLAYAFYGPAYFNSGQLVQGKADMLISYGLPFIATVLFWRYKSATPGKMLLKLQIVDAKTGLKPSVGQSAIRYIGYFVSTIVFFLGFIWIGLDKKKQGWHDKMASTVVIRPQNKGVEEVGFD